MQFNHPRPLAFLVLGFSTLIAFLHAEPGHVFSPVTPAQIALIEAALPQASSAPTQPRRLLVFYRTEGFVHKSIPIGMMALQRLGEKTKAFTTVTSEDMAMFEPDTLAGFDAVLLLNTTKLKFEDPKHREALLAYIRSGKGFVGIHAAADNFSTWPEGKALIGGVFCNHPWNANDVSAVKLDDPKHVLNAPFGGTGFWIREEIYQFGPPYSRDHQRVLLSLDMSKPQNARPADKIQRTDNDFAVSWIRTEGQGRIFYTSLGHREDIFYVPPILQHLLEGIRYALGDLPVDDTVSSKASPTPPALAPDDVTPIQDRSITPPISATNSPPPAAPSTIQPKHNSKIEEAANTARLPAAHVPSLAAEADALAILRNPASSLENKFGAFEQLSLSATAASIPTLATTAVSDELGLAERSALVLAQLRLPEAQVVLLTIIEKRAAGTRAPFITALRAYATPPVIARLSSLAKDSNTHDAACARAALASFGTRAALDALLTLPAGPDTTRHALAAADAWLSRDASAAPEVAHTATQLLKQSTTPSDRVEAVNLMGKTLTLSESTDLLDLVSDPEPRVRQAAVTAVVRSRNPIAITKLAARWPTLSNDTQIAAISAVTDTTGLALLRLALDSKDSAVAIAGIDGFARIQDVDALISLIPRLGETGPLHDATYTALARAQTKELSSLLATAAAKEDKPVAIRTALLALLGDRQVQAAQPLLVALCKSPDDKLRAAAFQALGLLPSSTELASIIELSNHAKKSADQRGFRKVLFNAVSATANPTQATELLSTALTDPTRTDRTLFIGALTLVTDPKAEALLAQLLTTPVAADRKNVIRALAAARTEGSLRLLQKVANSHNADDERILAVRGCIDTIPLLDPDPKGEKQVEWFRSIWPLASRDEEKAAIIAAVKNISKPGNATKRFLLEFASTETNADSAAANENK